MFHAYMEGNQFVRSGSSPCIVSSRGTSLCLAAMLEKLRACAYKINVWYIFSKHPVFLVHILEKLYGLHCGDEKVRVSLSEVCVSHI